jgi:hypothetical protein
MGQGALQVSDEANLAAGQQAWKLHTQATSRGVARHSMEPKWSQTAPCALILWQMSRLDY